MAETTNLNIRIDKELKERAEALFADMGMSMTTAFNIFVRQTLRQGKIPFEIYGDVPNAVTAAAIDEGRRMLQDENAKGYHSIEALKAALDV